MGYDFRENALTSGFSPILKAGFFQDCNMVPLYFTTIGIRYAYVFASDYTIGASISIGVMNGEEWWTKTRNFSFMPLPIFEVARRIYHDNTLRLGAVFAPTNEAMSATSGGGLFFMMLSYSHSIN